MKPISVLLVDDSALVRTRLKQDLERAPDIRVIGSAPDPYVARDLIESKPPDVIILDIGMPRMDGLTFLRKLNKYHPIPTIILSSLTEKGCDLALACLEAGAFDVRSKPNGSYSIGELSVELAELIRAAVGFDPRCRVGYSNAPSALPAVSMIDTTHKIVVIGASTGGTQALGRVLKALPADGPGIAIVQHMPEQFTGNFARRLDNECKPTVREARDGDRILPGHILIAPGGKQMKLARDGVQFVVRVAPGPRVCRHLPSVEVLFETTARNAGRNAMGVIMTGMGNDGSNAMKSLHDAGAYTVAQDEESCVVFGMPKEAIKHGGVDEVVPLDQIADRILQFGARKFGMRRAS